ncbi:hypothetical protein [Ramlibacter henchirensis]|jgi:hypothetical protein|nr:hypothetical protein [Ramlibacter henchirensis]
MNLTPHARKLAAWAGAAVALGAVFAMYTHPEIAVMVAEQIWACFGR